METHEPIHEGFLLLPPSGKILKKSWQKRFCSLYKRSSSGIARMEIYETEAKTGQVKIVTLEDVIKITPKSPNVFNILTKTADYDFGTMSDDFLNIWFRAVQSVAFPDEISQITSIEEDNDLYCSTDVGVFYVKLYPSDASKRCQLETKNYTLVLTSTALQLCSETDGRLLYTWPYCYIRRYGYKSGRFTFEAGRKCASGEGTFFLEHPNQQEIYRCLASKMKSMKKLLNSDSTTSLLDCGDVQLHAALSMEARSRSPLPPSPTTLLHSRSSQSSLCESNLTSRSHISFSSQTIESVSLVKPLPKKPPRKYIPKRSEAFIPIVSIKADSDYQEVNPDEFSTEEISNSHWSKYDAVENRKEAWKTMGVEDPSHTEQSPSDPEEEYVSWGVDTLTKSVSKMKLTEKSHAPAVITEPNLSSDDQYYDHLNFFGSSSRLNVSSGYKQVMPPPLPPVTTPLAVNLYDEVQVMESARSADDSHLGYALIRKDATSGTLKEIETEEEAPSKVTSSVEVGKELEHVSHQFHNNEPYAVISKPKRV